MAKKERHPKERHLFDKITTIILILICIFLATNIVLNMRETSGSSPEGMGGRPFTSMDQDAAPEGEAEAVNVAAITITPSTFIATKQLNGELVDDLDDVIITSDTNGEILDLAVNEGDQVDFDDILCYIDPSTAGASYKASPQKADTAGTIRDIMVIEHENVSEGQTLMTIETPAELEISTKISEKYLSSLEIGADATFTTQAWPDDELSAQLSFIDTDVNPEVHWLFFLTVWLIY